MFSTRALLIIGSAVTVLGVSAVAAAGPSSIFDRIRESRTQGRTPGSMQVGTSMGGDKIVISRTLGRVAQSAPHDRTPISLLTRHLGDPDTGKSKDDDDRRSNRENIENGDRDHHDHHKHHHHHP